MKKYVFAILISLFLFYPSQGFAEVKEIVSEGTYNMGDGETPSVAESRALLQAKRIALEKAGTYVESYSKVINLKLTEDEIQVLASGLMEVEILDKKRTVIGDGIHFWVKIKARVNLDKTGELANRIKAKDKSFVEDYKKIQAAYDKSQKDIEELKKQLAQAKGEKEKNRVEAKITDEERLFQANEWFEKGNEYALTDLEKALQAGGIIVDNKENLTDLQKALRAGGQVITATNKEYDKAIEAYTSAIALNPNLDNAYYNLGGAYYNKGQYDRAIKNYNKAIAVNPHATGVYNSLGVVYANRGDMGRAISYYQKACDMGDEIGCEGVQWVLKNR